MLGFQTESAAMSINLTIFTGKGGGEKANYFIIIVHLLSSVIIGYHHPNRGFDSRRLNYLKYFSAFHLSIRLNKQK